MFSNDELDRAKIGFVETLRRMRDVDVKLTRIASTMHMGVMCAEESIVLLDSFRGASLKDGKRLLSQMKKCIAETERINSDVSALLLEFSGIK